MVLRRCDLIFGPLSAKQSTWAVAVCGRLRDGARQGAAAGLGGVFAEFLFVLHVSKLDLKRTKKQIDVIHKTVLSVHVDQMASQVYYVFF